MLVSQDQTPQVLLSKYIEECESKAKYHRKNGTNALNWWNFLGIVNVILTSLNALSMTILGVYRASEVSIAVTGGVFALVTAVFTRIQMSFSFNSLSVQHNQVCDDFEELSQNFKLLLYDSEAGNFDLIAYKHDIARLISIDEKSHLQPVRECRYILCCC